MNPGTYYLYEYDNAKRRRNVGFIKVSRHYQSCILQIHAKGIPPGGASGASPLELIAFYHENGRLVGSHIAGLDYTGRTLALRLPVPESSFPGKRALSQIDGFLIRILGEQLRLFWMASAFFFDVNPDMLTVLSDAGENDESKTPADMPVDKKISSSPTEEAQEPQIQPVQTAEPEPDQQMEQDETPAQPSPPEEAALETAESPDLPRVKKIQRSDLSVLPRRFWHLANNSFLLHGCRSYHHLLLIEENGRMWLGVPGVYDTNEARAADLFGFPRFTRAYVVSAGLGEDEQSDGADFGHWCRCVGTCGNDGCRQMAEPMP